MLYAMRGDAMTEVEVQTEDSHAEDMHECACGECKKMIQKGQLFASGNCEYRWLVANGHSTAEEQEGDDNMDNVNFGL